jgi:GNAT superfamily N-acetyltransferase
MVFISVVVHPEHRGKGLGRFLMAKTEEYAKR